MFGVRVLESKGLWRAAIVVALCAAAIALVSTISPMAAGAQGCIDDSFEENDNGFLPASVPANGSLSAQYCLGDDDWFDFPVTAGQTVEMEIVTPGPALSWLLVDGNGDFVRSGNSNSPLLYLASSTGDFAVRINGAASTPYDLSVTTAVCADDGFEDNDSFATAGLLPAGESLSAQYCLGDSDWYQFPVVTGDLITVTMSHIAADGDLDIFLVDETNAFVASTFGSTADDESIFYAATSSGDWRVLVGIGAAENSYELSVSQSDGCGGLPITVDLNLGQSPTTANDVILGTSGPDVINGLAGDDVICGMGGADVINGGAGVDTIFGGDGDDIIGGQGGADTLYGDNGNDRINGGVGNDEAFGGGGDDDLRGQGNDDTLHGGPGVDQFFGGSGNDTINTGGGGNLGTAQVVRGGGNNDIINGSGQDDDLEGGTGLDELSGFGGDDLLRGGAGSDDLFGGAGADRLEGGSQRDFLFGGAGNDDLLGGTGNDDLFGEAGDDSLNGQGDTDLCNGGTTGEIAGDTATATCESVVDVP